MSYVFGMNGIKNKNISPEQALLNMAGEQKFNVGDIVVTKDYVSSLSSYFEPGTKVTIIDVDENRGYDLQDEQGNKIFETGFNSVCTEKEFEEMQEGIEME